MKELFDCMDALVDVEEVIRKTAPKHALSEAEKELVQKRLRTAQRNINALRKKLGVEE
ncbi:MAG: DUF2100 domain-containing protein [Euryarchaeota archaeon]|nr:DUF2100 domain-containing protein [Euryarchaeota archaeon]